MRLATAREAARGGSPPYDFKRSISMNLFERRVETITPRGTGAVRRALRTSPFEDFVRRFNRAIKKKCTPRGGGGPGVAAASLGGKEERAIRSSNYLSIPPSYIKTGSTKPGSEIPRAATHAE